MVDKNDSLLREVDEELRREQWAKLWDQYGIYVISAASLIVALVGGYKFWEARQLARAEAGGAQFEAALDLSKLGKAEAAEKALQAIVAEGPRGYETLAEFTLAGAHLKAGQPQEALAIFEKLSKDSRADDLLASFAALQAASLRLGDADFTEMQNRINALAADDGPWRYNARELLGIAALKAGKLDQARNTFAPLLADPQVPEGTVERVRRMMAAIASTELSKTAPLPAAAPASPGAQAPGSGGEADKPTSPPN
jgi:hypothetical protein